MCGTVVPLLSLCFANDLNTVLLYAAQGETMSGEWLAILGISGGALCVLCLWLFDGPVGMNSVRS